MAPTLARLAGVLLLCLAVGATASAQYGGGSTGGSGGTGSGAGKAIGIGVGVAAAAGVGIALLIHHHHKVSSSDASLAGCTQSLLQGIGLKNDNDNQTYVLLSSAKLLQPGELVELKGTVVNDRSGTRAFQVREVVKNYGACAAALAMKEQPASGAPELAQTDK